MKIKMIEFINRIIKVINNKNYNLTKKDIIFYLEEIKKKYKEEE